MTNPSSNLTQKDLEAFRRLGVSPELLDRVGVDRVTDEQARTVYGIGGTGDNAGIVFPYFSHRTGNRVSARLRRDNPEIEDGQPKNKYVSAYGDRKHLYIIPGCAHLINNPAVPVILMESEKAVLAITGWSERMNYPVLPIGMGGCWGWRGRIGKAESSNGKTVDEVGPLGDLDICRERPAIIMLDSNAADNSSVQAARRSLETSRRLRFDILT